MKGKAILTVGAVLLALVVGIGVLAMAGDTLKDEAGAVLIGVVCGIAAGVPTSALLLIVLALHDRPRPTGFVTTGGQVVEAEIVHLGEANTYNTEMALYCPCPKGQAGEREVCFIAKGHGLGDAPCPYAGGE